MGDKSPRKPNRKKAGRTIKEKRAAKKLKHDPQPGVSETIQHHHR